MRNSVSRILPLTLVALFAAGCASTPETPAPTAQARPAAPAAPAAAAPAPAAAPKPADPNMSYYVLRGDHLWGISGRGNVYGNPYQWPLIFKSNRDKIKDADVIEPGQVFTIVKKPADADIAVAVEHAKKRGEWKLGSVEGSDTAYLNKK